MLNVLNRPAIAAPAGKPVHRVVLSKQKEARTPPRPGIALSDAKIAIVGGLLPIPAPGRLAAILAVILSCIPRLSFADSTAAAPPSQAKFETAGVVFF